MNARAGPHPSSLAEQAIVAVRDLNLAAAAFRSALAARYRVGVTDTYAVSCLAASGPLGQRELAECLSLSTSAVTSLLDRLETVGVVERRPHPSDRRRIEVRLTEYGKSAVSETGTGCAPSPSGSTPTNWPPRPG